MNMKGCEIKFFLTLNNFKIDKLNFSIYKLKF